MSNLLDRLGMRSARPVRVGLLGKWEQIKSWPETHKLILKYRGLEVGEVLLEKIVGEENSFFVFDLKVDDKFQRANPLNKKPEEYLGFGSELIELVNEFLISRGAIGLLDDGITKKAALGMYKRHGWVPTDIKIIKTKNNQPALFFDGSKPGRR